MKSTRLLVLAVVCMAITLPAQASMHPNAAIDSLAHFMWHMQMTTQAAMTGNWPAFWALFLEQSVCAQGSFATFIFTPLGFVLAAALLVSFLVMMAFHLIKKMLRSWKQSAPHTLQYA